MNKQLQLIALAALLFWLSGCNKTSEATINVCNQSEMKIHVNISSMIMQIGPGLTGTFDLSWEGGGSVIVNMLSYPVNDSTNYKTQTVELKNGDLITINVKFTSE